MRIGRNKQGNEIKGNKENMEQIKNMMKQGKTQQLKTRENRDTGKMFRGHHCHDDGSSIHL
jgi:hypothetical protein